MNCLPAQGHASLQGHLQPTAGQLGVQRPRIPIFSWGQLRPMQGLHHSSVLPSAQSCSHPCLPQVLILKELRNKYPHAELQLRLCRREPNLQ